MQILPCRKIDEWRVANDRGAASAVDTRNADPLTAIRTGSALENKVLCPFPGPILTAHGPASALLRSWKVAQTLIEIWSGVATDARAIVDAASEVAPNIAVACTRKNVPGTKRFAVAAVKAGGAVMHRLGLSETVLVFPEHRAFLGEEMLAESVARLRRAAPEKKLVIEVNTLQEAIVAASVGFDVIQAEKFTPAEIASLVARMAIMAAERSSYPVIAAAGGIHAGNVAAYAMAGANIV
uniref:ModD protein n=1 Tax=Bradyrhizobium sp. TaxID=376 RepID=UPI0025BA69D0